MKLACLAIALAACGGRSKDACKADAEDLGQRLAEVDHDPSLLYVEGSHLVERSDLAKPELREAPTLRLTSDAIVFQDSKIALDDLPARLVDARRKLEESIERYPQLKRETDPHLLYLVVDAGATWGQVVRVVDAAVRADFDAARFVFARPFHGRRPPPSKVEAELDAIVHNHDGASISSGLAKKIQTTVADCPAIIRVFGELAATEGGYKTDFLIQHIPDALVDCNCNLDMPSFATEMWYVMANEHPVGVIAVQIDPTGTAIELPAITPWREASKQLTPTMKSVALRAR